MLDLAVAFIGGVCVGAGIVWTLLIREIRLVRDVNRHFAKFDHDGDGRPGGSVKR